MLVITRVNGIFQVIESFVYLATIFALFTEIHGKREIYGNFF